MSSVLAIPSEGVYFEGHFPGRPILPGVIELALVVDAIKAISAQAMGPATLRAIPFVRLRQLVLPGDRLELESRAQADGRVRFDLKRADSSVANGELRLGPLKELAADAASSVIEVQPVSDVPPLDRLLPHRAPMRFITSIVGESESGLVCRALIPAACALVEGESAPALAAIEAAAQTAAAWDALRRSREGGSDVAPRIGYLVSLRDIELFAERIPAERTLSVNVRLEAAALPLTHYAIEVTLDERAVLRGKIATFLTDEGSKQ